MTVRLVKIPDHPNQWLVLSDGHPVGRCSRMSDGYITTLDGYPEIGQFGQHFSGALTGSFYKKYKKDVVPTVEHVVKYRCLPVNIC